MEGKGLGPWSFNMDDKLAIYTYPNSVLRAETEPVESIDGDLQSFIDKMAETMWF